MCIPRMGGLISNLPLFQMAEDADAADRFRLALHSDGRFLALLYLMAWLPYGAAFVPPLLGMEGVLLGASVSAAYLEVGITGALGLLTAMCFRLLLVLPYGFLLGSWSVGQCLQYGAFPRDGGRARFAVLCVTLLVLFATSLLEATVGQTLRGMYLSKFGV